MVRNADDRSFLTWEQTLYPRPSSNDGSAWAAVHQHDAMSEVTMDDHHPIPIAVEVVAVDGGDDVDAEHSTLTPHTRQHPPYLASTDEHRGHGYRHSNSTSNSSYNNDGRLSAYRSSQGDGPHGDSEHDDGTPNGSSAGGTPPLQPWRNSNLIDLILGMVFCLATFLVTIKLEFTAFLLYTLAAGCHYVAETCLDFAPLMMFKMLLLFLSSVFMLVDSILLIVSVVSTEILAAVAMLLCTTFAGPRSGQEWHQFIRRTCHSTRCTVRGCHKGWKPERVIPFDLDSQEGGDAQCTPTTDEEEHQQGDGRSYSDGQEGFQDEDQQQQQSPGSAMQTQFRNHSNPNQESPPLAAAAAAGGSVLLSSESVHIVQEEGTHDEHNNDDLVKNTRQVQID